MYPNAPLFKLDVSAIELPYVQVKEINSSDNGAVVIHFPKSKLNRKYSSIIYHASRIESYELALQLKKFHVGNEVQLYTNREVGFIYDFIFRKAEVPVVVYEPFYINCFDEKSLQFTIQILKQLVIQEKIKNTCF